MDKKKILAGIIAVILLLVFAVYLAKAQILLGTAEGYVTNATGHLISGADVRVNVSGCSGTGCTGTTQTDSGGYYVITNLNINAGDNVTAEANKSTAYGTNTETADNYQAAYINITIAQVPGTPTLQSINDTHNNTLIIYNWTPGTDPQGLSTYDNWTLSGTTYFNATPPQNRTNVAFTTYTWSVKTCNAYGCSPSASDTFNVYNTAPPSPVLQNQSDGLNTTRIFNWSSGGADPENDSTYFEFKIDSGSVESNVTPPLNRTLGYGSHTWKARECDPWTCSSWSTDTFMITNNAPSNPALTNISDFYSPETATFTWTSGTDADGHATYDEFKFNGTTYSNVTSPQTKDLTGIVDYFVWEARTCDVHGACSSWINDTFIKYACPAPGWTQ